MREYITGTTKIIDNELYVDTVTPPDGHKHHIFKVIDSPIMIVGEGEQVDGYLIVINRQNKKYGFMVFKMAEGYDQATVELTSFITMIDVTTVNRMNMEATLFDKAKQFVNISDIYSDTRRREVVICRHISQYMVNKLFQYKLVESRLEEIHQKDRCSIKWGVENISNLYDNSPQIKKIVDDVENAMKIIYNNLTNKSLTNLKKN